MNTWTQTVAGSEARCFTHAGLEVHGEQLVEWIALDQVRALSSGEAEHYGIEDDSARGIFTKHMYEEIGRTINIDVDMDATTAMGMCSRTGVVKTRHIQVRWLWIQDAIRDKVVRLKKVRGTDNEADMGTKDLDGPTHQRFFMAITAQHAHELCWVDEEERWRMWPLACREAGGRVTTNAYVRDLASTNRMAGMAGDWNLSSMGCLCSEVPGNDRLWPVRFWPKLVFSVLAIFGQ